MLRRGKDVTDLQRELTQVRARIDTHPLASDRVRAAQNLVEEMKEQGSESAAINEALDARDLPLLHELGSIQVKTLWSWGRLHRRRQRLEDQLPQEP